MRSKFTHFLGLTEKHSIDRKCENGALRRPYQDAREPFYHSNHSSKENQSSNALTNNPHLQSHENTITLQNHNKSSFSKMAKGKYTFSIYFKWY